MNVRVGEMLANRVRRHVPVGGRRSGFVFGARCFFIVSQSSQRDVY